MATKDTEERVMVTTRTMQILVGIGAVLMLLLCCVASVSVGGYNSLVQSDENVKNMWAQVQNQYQRRTDLAEQLVATTGAGMAQELAVFKTLRDQAAALSGAFQTDQYGQTVIPEGAEAEKLQTMIDEFDQSLINAVVYIADNPELFSGELLSDLMVQIEGSENRVSVARRDYNDAVSSYRQATRRFPEAIYAMIFGFDANRYPYFQAEDQDAPVIAFPTPNMN